MRQMYYYPRILGAIKKEKETTKNEKYQNNNSNQRIRISHC